MKVIDGGGYEPLVLDLSPPPGAAPPPQPPTALPLPPYIRPFGPREEEAAPAPTPTLPPYIRPFGPKEEEAAPAPTPTPLPPEPEDTGDIHPDYEAGVLWTDELLDSLEDEALGWETGVRFLASSGGGGPGTILSSVAAHKARPLGDWESDNALDITLLLGTPITAVAPGYVSGAVGPCGGNKVRTGPTTKCSGRGYGLCDKNPAGIRAGFRLAICHDSGMISFYHHMTELVVKPGARVAQGDILGYSGSANGSAHLHFAVSPPFTPKVFYLRAFRLSGRKPRTAISPTPAKIPSMIPAALWNEPTLEGGWGKLMDVFTDSWPTATRTIHNVRRTLLDVLE